MVERLLDRAELLIWLALPWEVCSRRLVEREATRPVPSSRESFQALMAYGAAYDTRTNDISRHGHQRLFEMFGGMKVRLEVVRR